MTNYGLHKSPINKNYINLPRSLYDGSLAAIKTDLGTSRHVSIKKGVKKGDMLSAKRAKNKCPDSGYSIGGQILSNLADADDIAVTNKDIQELQDFLNALAANAKDIGLEINLKKTECITTDKIQQFSMIKLR